MNVSDSKVQPEPGIIIAIGAILGLVVNIAILEAQPCPPIEKQLAGRAEFPPPVARSFSSSTILTSRAYPFSTQIRNTKEQQ